RVAPGAVDVWRADLRTVRDEVLASLSKAERHRSARFLRPHDGLLWARARGLLRALLARYLDVEASSVEFRVDGHGKPTLARTMRSRRLSFNVSHSGTLALYAFTRAASVGIDVQSFRGRPIDEVAIARRAFGAAESARLRELEPPTRRREFLRLWVR